jgi:hypothetical protein
MTLAYIASEVGTSSRFENNDTPIPIVIDATETKPPGTYVVHDEVTSSIGPQKKPKPAKTSNTMKNLLSGGSFASGQISP